MKKVVMNEKNRQQDRFLKRDSGIELFRIVVMLLIIAHHYVVNSGLTSIDGPIYADPLSWRSIFLLVFGAWGKIGINCFILITGYYMCDSQISSKKFVRLFAQVIFYKITIHLIFLLFGYETFSLRWLADVLVPYREINKGFTFCYLLFYLTIPFLNILIRHSNQKQHRNLLLLCSFIYMIFGTLPFFSVSMNYVSWFIVLFFLASYLKRYPIPILNHPNYWIWITLGFVILDIGSVVFCTWLGVKLNRQIAYYLVTDSNTLLAVLTGVSAFLMFKNLRIRKNKWINLIASTTFGVFLIHANSDTMRKWLWETIFDCVGHYQDNMLPLYAISTISIIFIVGSLIDYIRKVSIEGWAFRWIDKIGNKTVVRN